MSFEEKYQLLELVEDQGVQTYAARESSTGRPLAVFLFAAEQTPLQATLLARIRAATPLQLPELVEIGVHQGSPYVVTQPLRGFYELEARVLQAAQPGEFTQMFQAAAPPLGESLPGKPQAPRRPAKPAPPAQAAPGSFTQMFQAAAPPLGESLQGTPQAPQRPAEPAPPAQAAPGSFTQMFQAAAPPMGESRPAGARMTQSAPPPPKSAPGEFTQFFNAPTPGSVTSAPPLLPTGDRGDHASIFGSGNAGATPATATGLFVRASSDATLPQVQPGSVPLSGSPRAFPPAAGEFTQIFEASSGKAPATGASAAPAGSPGEYTQMFGAAQIQSDLAMRPPAGPEPCTAPAVASRTALSAAPASPKYSRLVPVLIGIILVQLAVIAALVFTMKK